MHVVCALYVPGVAFGDIDKLRPVTLTEMNYSKYGAKASTFNSFIYFLKIFPPAELFLLNMVLMFNVQQKPL